MVTPPLLAVAALHPRHSAVTGRGPAAGGGCGDLHLGPGFGLPFALGFQVLRSFSTALSRAVPPLVVMVLAILFNALGDYTLIFGHFGLPRLGLLGAGLASACSNLFSFVADAGGHALATPGLKRLSHPAPAGAAALARLWRNCSAWAFPSA